MAFGGRFGNALCVVLILLTVFYRASVVVVVASTYSISTTIVYSINPSSGQAISTNLCFYSGALYWGAGVSNTGTPSNVDVYKFTIPSGTSITAPTSNVGNKPNLKGLTAIQQYSGGYYFAGPGTSSGSSNFFMSASSSASSVSTSDTKSYYTSSLSPVSFQIFPKQLITFVSQIMLYSIQQTVIITMLIQVVAQSEKLKWVLLIHKYAIQVLMHLMQYILTQVAMYVSYE